MFKRTLPFLTLIISLCFQPATAQKFDGLSLTPAMGWNTWNEFACDVNEDLIKTMADAIVESGMRDAGYVYINIDDCWHGERDENGFITVDKVKFPSGMKALSDYLHAKGLKLGIYSDAGYKTCAGYPGSRGYEYQDALQYAKWGVDYLKYDWCNTDGLQARGAYMTMRDAIANAGRPILFSMCEWGTDVPWEWGAQVAHSWRTSGDIWPCFDCEKIYDEGLPTQWSSWGVTKIIDMREGIRKYAGPDHFNDFDMMEVGNGMAPGEDRVHFVMWSMLASPLIAGNDIRTMSDETRTLLTNKDIIAVNQDSLGVQAFRYTVLNSTGVWFKALQDGDIAVAFLNRSKDDHTINFAWTNHVINDPDFDYTFDFTKNTYKIRDLISHKNLGKTSKPTNFTVPGHDIVLFKLEKQ